MAHPIQSNDATCVLCPDDRHRIPNRPPVCDACRSWLAALLGDIRILAEQLIATPERIPDVRTIVVLLGDGTPAPLNDVVTQAAPAAFTPGKSSGPHVALTPDSRPPIGLDRIDLAGAARLPNPVRGRGHYPRSLWPEDQVGHQPIATILDLWTRDWIGARGRGEHLPAATTDVLTRWLANRVEWACDQHPAVVEFATEMRQARSVLRGVLGLSDQPEYMKGVPCKNDKCGMLALYRQIGSEWVECGACPNMLSPEEYADWVTRAVEESPAVRAALAKSETA